MGHITEANNPTTGNAITEILADPNKAVDKLKSAPTAAPINTLRLSKTLSSNTPARQPVGRSLFTTHIGKHRYEVKPHYTLPSQLSKHVQRTYAFVGGVLNLREPRKQQNN